VEVGVHSGLEDFDFTQFIKFGGMGVVIKSAGDEHIEVGFRSFIGGFNQVGAGYGSEYTADKDSRPAVRFPVKVSPLGADETARPGSKGKKINFVILVRLLNSGCFEVFTNDSREIFFLAMDGCGSVASSA
jgi:hypothetical protein